MGNKVQQNLAHEITPAVNVWLWIGIFILFFELYVLGRWITGPNFVPTAPGTDPVSKFTQWVIIVSQPFAVILGLILAWFFVIRPWLREKRLTTNAMLAICWTFLFFWDPIMNYTSHQILYNSHLINFGAWANGSMPGWISPNGNNLPMPLLILIPGYLFAGWGPILLVFWALRKCKQRWPSLTKLSLAGIGILALTFTDTIVEVIFCQTGIYAYPGGIREVTLFAGSTSQFPLTEAVIFGGLGQGATLLLLLFTDDKGNTFVERGLEKMKISYKAKQRKKFIALYGYTHLCLIIFFIVPAQWLAIHSDPFPEGYPSYMINNMCVYGPERDQCPGPGVMMPRPENNPF